MYFYFPVDIVSTASLIPWIPLGSSSVTCGNGTQTGKRVGSTPDGNAGSCDEDQEITKSIHCNTRRCHTFITQFLNS